MCQSQGRLPEVLHSRALWKHVLPGSGEDDICDGSGSGRGMEGTALNSERGTGELAWD